ncbi:MAG: hypothetical protein IT457_12255 [Planctomycetes bacterium]|nr:hypothetical protein [Planctomycetota bacterium]
MPERIPARSSPVCEPARSPAPRRARRPVPAGVCALLLVAKLAAQGGLPPIPVPPENPITEEKRVLGKLLFWEEQLSSNNLMACGTCHRPGSGGGDPRRQPSPGLDGTLGTPDDNFASPGVIRSDSANHYESDPAFGLQPQVTRRATPSFILGAWFPRLSWDGRFPGSFRDPLSQALLIASGAALEDQALKPILDVIEMGHAGRTWSEVTNKLAAVRPMALASQVPADLSAALANGARYPELFAAAFGDPAITPSRIAYALATYERTLIPDQTPWDRFQRGEPGAMTPNQIAGMNVFNGIGRCNLCHVPGLFSDAQFRNLGLRPIAQDGGLAESSGDPADRGKFKVPSLRNVGLRPSFFHAGGLTGFNLVLNFYVAGGGTNRDNQDPLLQPLTLTPQQRGQLTDFVTNALTDPRVAAETSPFDRPTLLSERVPAAGFLYGPGTAGSGNRVPQMLAEVPANLGNVDFRIGVGNARGGAPATLLLGLQAAPPGTQINGVNLHVALGASPLLVNLPLGGATGQAGAGTATLAAPLPTDPALSGVVLFAQWLVWDLGAPAGVAASRGAQLRFF